jgi:hypothetical protein
MQDYKYVDFKKHMARKAAYQERLEANAKFKERMIEDAVKRGDMTTARQAMQMKVVDKKRDKLANDLKSDELLMKRAYRKKLERAVRDGDLPKDFDTDAVMRKQKPAKSQKELMVEQALSNNDNELMQRVIGGEFGDK